MYCILRNVSQFFVSHLIDHIFNRVATRQRQFGIRGVDSNESNLLTVCRFTVHAFVSKCRHLLFEQDFSGWIPALRPHYYKVLVHTLTSDY